MNSVFGFIILASFLYLSSYANCDVAHIFSTSNGITIRKRSDKTACRAVVNYQYLNFRNTTCRSYVKVENESKICDGNIESSIKEIIIGSTIKVESQLQSSDQFLLTVRELHGTCTQIGYHERISAENIEGVIEVPISLQEKHRCIYEFEVNKEYCGVKLTFAKFNFMGSKDCSGDHVEIQNRLYCRQDLKDKIVTFKNPVNLTIVYESKPSTEASFEATYVFTKDCTTANQCNAEFFGRNGHIRAPVDDHQNYLDNLHCTYHIRRFENSACVAMKFNTIDLENEKKIVCDNDYIEYNGFKTCELTKVSTEHFLSFEKNEMTEIKFVSDGSGHKQIGFDMFFWQVAEPDKCPLMRCSSDVDTKIAIIHNPKYPNLYPKDYHCVYVIRQQPGCDSIDIALFSKLATGDKLNVIQEKSDELLSEDISNNYKFVQDPQEGNAHVVKIKFDSDNEDETTFTFTANQRCT
ncbi:Uncharacterised protein at_DN1201 [Pycnogonum litorale]